MADKDTRGDMEKAGRTVHAPTPSSPPSGAPPPVSSGALWHGPRSIASLVPVVTRAAFRRGTPGAYQVLEAWPAIVGPMLAAVTQPRAMGRGTLTIACAGPVAMELQHLSPELLQRINRYLGGETVQRLRFVQTLTLPPAAPVKPPVPPAIERAVEASVASLPEGPLREALAALGRAVLTEARTKTQTKIQTGP